MVIKYNSQQKVSVLSRALSRNANLLPENMYISYPLAEYADQWKQGKKKSEKEIEMVGKVS